MNNIKVIIKHPFTDKIYLDDIFIDNITVKDIKKIIMKENNISIYSIKLFIDTHVSSDDETLEKLDKKNNIIYFNIIFKAYDDFNKETYNKAIKYIYDNNDLALNEILHLPIDLNYPIVKDNYTTKLINISCDDNVKTLIMRLLLDGKADVNTQDNNLSPPLFDSIKLCNKTINININKIKLLLDYRADVNYSHNNVTPLKKCITTVTDNGILINILNILISYKANPNINEIKYIDERTSKLEEITPLMLCVKNNRFDLFSSLIKSSLIDVNIKSYPNNYTALMYAGIYNFKDEIVVELLKHSADIDLKNTDCETYNSLLVKYNK